MPSAAQKNPRHPIDSAALRAAIADAGLSQSELARRTGVGQAFLSRLVRGRARQCRADVIVALARELGVAPGSLLDSSAQRGTRASQFRPVEEWTAMEQALRAAGYAELPATLQLAVEPDAWAWLVLEPLPRVAETMALPPHPGETTPAPARRRTAQGVATLVQHVVGPVADGRRALAPHALAAGRVAACLWELLASGSRVRDALARRDLARALTERSAVQSEEAFRLEISYELCALELARRQLAHLWRDLDHALDPSDASLAAYASSLRQLSADDLEAERDRLVAPPLFARP